MPIHNSDTGSRDGSAAKTEEREQGVVSDIFISYSSADRDSARMLAGPLERKGWSVWWDRSILPGKTYDRVIEKELEAASCVIVIWTRESVESDWVRAEAGEALSRGNLVPVLREEVEIPLVFRQIHAAHLQDWEGDTQHPGFQQLIKAVAANVGSGAQEGVSRGAETAAARIEELRRQALSAKSMDELTAVRDSLDDLLSSGEEVTGAKELRQQIESAIKRSSATGDPGASGGVAHTAAPQTDSNRPGRPLAVKAAAVAVVGVLAAGGWFVYQQTRPVTNFEQEAAQRQAREEAARRRVIEEQERLGEEEDARRAEEEAARRAEEAERQRLLERQRREEETQREIERLLAAAQDALADDRLSVPRDDGALGHYRRVLSLDPGNPAARQGLMDVGSRYAELAVRAMEQGNLDDTDLYLVRAQSLTGDAEPLRAPRVRRGGSWYDDPWYFRSADRYGYDPVDRNDFVGFRLAQDL